MGGTVRGLQSAAFAFAVLWIVSGGALAQDFEVTETPFRVDHTLSQGTRWNTYELNAAVDQRVSYSVTVTTADACVILLFVKGHGIGPESAYFGTYSEERCVSNYANVFPVESADGTEFTVLIDTQSQGDVTYHLAIDIQAPVLPTWAVALFVAVGIGLAPAIVWTTWRRLVHRRPPSPDRESTDAHSIAAAQPPPPPPPLG